MYENAQLGTVVRCVPSEDLQQQQHYALNTSLSSTFLYYDWSNNNVGELWGVYSFARVAITKYHWVA